MFSQCKFEYLSKDLLGCDVILATSVPEIGSLYKRAFLTVPVCALRWCQGLIPVGFYIQIVTFSLGDRTV